MFAEYNFKIQYKQCSENSSGDYLSGQLQASDLFLTLQVESNLKNIVRYPETSKLHEITDKSVQRAIKFEVRYYVQDDG